MIVFRDEYLKKESPGLKAFQLLRIGNSCQLVDSLNASPKYYRALRETSLKIGSYEPKMRASSRALSELYPDAVFPDVYFLIGRMNSAGTVSSAGLLIGVDLFGKNSRNTLDELSSWHRAVIAPTDRMPYIVAHELIHYQQKYPRDKEWTLLGKTLNEGSADFVGELIAGSNINPHLHAYGNPIEKQMWLEFKKEMSGTDASNWLYQGDKSKDRPADLGYYNWV